MCCGLWQPLIKLSLKQLRHKWWICICKLTPNSEMQRLVGGQDEVWSVMQRMPQHLKMDTHHVLMHKDWFMDVQVSRCNCSGAFMNKTTVILTSLYSQIYSPSHRQKERVEERKKAQQCQWVSIRKKKSCIDIMEVWSGHAEKKSDLKLQIRLNREDTP